MSTMLPSLSFNTTKATEDLSVSTTTIASTNANVYDHQGAAFYIAVILVWYSTGLAMMLFLQVRPRSLQQQFSFDLAQSSTRDRIKKAKTNPLMDYRTVAADHATKQILNELKDPERRQRLWKIYYRSGEKENEHYPQYYQTLTSDSATIDRINKKLAGIHRVDLGVEQKPQMPGDVASRHMSRPSLTGFDSAHFFSRRFSGLRRSTACSTTHGPMPSMQHSVDASSESEPLVMGKKSLLSSKTDYSHNDCSSTDRFFIEKVPENNTVHNTIDENAAE